MGGYEMADSTDFQVQWERNAVLQEKLQTTKASEWVGQQIYDGTVAGAVRHFKTLGRERQARAEMLVDAGVVEGSTETTFGVDTLDALAGRSDLPAA
jgi:hypothetical protein